MSPDDIVAVIILAVVGFAFLALQSGAESGGGDGKGKSL